MHQVLVGLNGLHIPGHMPLLHVHTHKALHRLRQAGQHGREIAGERGEGVDEHRANLV